MHFHLSGIIGWLLRFMFAPMALMAMGGSALAGVGDGGADMGDLGGDGDGDPGGEFEGGDGGAEDDLGAEEDLGDEGDRGQLTQQQRAAAAQDAKLPAGVRKALASLKESDPKAADALRRAYFGAQAWAQVFPSGIRQARETVQLVEEFGGVEGIRGLQDETQSLQAELDNIDEQWTSGSPEFIAKLAEQDPEAFCKAAPVILEQLQKTDKAAYNAVLGRIFWNTLNSQRVVGTLEALLHHANANKATAGFAPVIEQLTALLSWADGIQQLAQSQPDRKPDKAMEKLRQRETEFERKQFEGFKNDVGGEIKRHLETGILRSLGPLLKKQGVNLALLKAREPERFKALVREADSQIAEAISKDRAFQQQKDRLMQTRDRDRVLRFYQQKLDVLLTGPKGVAKRVANIFFRGAAAGNAAGQRGGQGQNRQQQRRQGNDGQGGGNQQDRVERISKSPDPLQIDRNRTSDDDILDGHAWLKGGKHVRWRNF